ncbi:zinc ABC transporter substrate-binding protein [Paenibacillus sp. N1-5-1-14]|uniref:metal ABC transporter substrate-binding protein n=1 Tax=Paenibacillus radicibacter TaxID=2972488 RepID=UPI0021597547|nr:zinc ABC transporter substrate-binding protein [Paenibacillus radicibacter]MCR8642443.1 zinc ABC transporter substrate-binding protein [Paenibacillus radicibacter]
MKRNYFIFTLLTIMMLVFVTGCGTSNRAKLAEDKINVVTSFYPLYDFTKKIGGEHVNVINLVPAGVEPHHWSPKSRDIKNVTDSDLFVYQGAGFEGWVDEFLKSLSKDAKVKPLMASEGISLIDADGHSHDDGHDHGKEEAHDHPHEGHDHGKEEEKAHANDGHDHGVGQYDPHAWLSVKNSKKMAENIKNQLVAIDGANKADYEANYAKLAKQFDDLDAKFKAEIAKTARKDIVVSHQAFGYLAHDYGLTQKSIMGLTADAEPTAQQMKDINKFIRDNNVTYIFFEELVSDKLAKTLANDAGIQTLVLNPLEGLTEEQLNAGQDYFSVMELNLNNLLKALQ